MTGTRISNKAQVSVEFVIIFAVMMVVFLLVFDVINARNEEFFFGTRSIDAKRIADKVAYSVNQVFLSGPGSNTSLYLPAALVDNIGYNLTAHSSARSIAIEWGGRHYVSILIAALKDPQTSLSPGRLDIRYTEEGIAFEQ